MLKCFFHRKYICAKTKIVVGCVGFPQGGHYLGSQSVFHHAKQSMVLGGPCMVSKVRQTIYASPAANLFPNGVTSLSKALQKLNNLLIVSLVICYKYCFHNSSF